MRPVAFGEALSPGTRLTLFSDDKLDRFFTVIKFWMDGTSGVALDLQTGVPTYQVEDEEGRTHLLLHVPIEEENEDPFPSANNSQPLIDMPLLAAEHRMIYQTLTLGNVARRLTSCGCLDKSSRGRRLDATRSSKSGDLLKVKSISAETRIRSPASMLFST